MRQVYLIIIFFFALGCNNQPVKVIQTKHIESIYQDGYERFIREAEKRGIYHLRDIPVSITTNNNIMLYNPDGSQYPVNGVCYPSQNRIEIKFENVFHYITTGEGWYLDYIIMHELGHCLLKRQHDYQGIMRPQFPSDWLRNDYYINNREQLLDYLFQKRILNRCL